MNQNDLASSATPVVFVIDDDASVRESLASLVQRAGWIAETFGSAQEFLCRPQALTPHCLVLEVSLPDISGLELQQRLSPHRIEMPIIFMTGYGDVATTVKAMKAGAVEFLTKPFHDDTLLNTIRDAINRSHALMGSAAEMRRLRECYESLTRREAEVMALVISGLLNKQVAGELGISEITVKAHRGSMMRKMNADSFAGLIGMAARLGVAPDPRPSAVSQKHPPQHRSRYDLHTHRYDERRFDRAVSVPVP
jgi:FixJ family two-component response regulator